MNVEKGVEKIGNFANGVANISQSIADWFNGVITFINDLPFFVKILIIVCIVIIVLYFKRLKQVTRLRRRYY